MYNKKWYKDYYQKNKDKIKQINKEKYQKICVNKNERFKKILEKKHGNKYTILGNYINYTTDLLLHCNICNYEWSSKPKNILRRTDCPNCVRIKKSTTENDFIKKLNEIHSNNLSLIDNFINYNIKVTIKCNICNHIWKVKPSHLIHSKSTCPICTNKIKHQNQIKSHEQFLLDVFRIHKDSLIIIDNYINAKTKIKIKCKICNSIWDAIPYSILQGVGCPTCKQSKGENRIENYLIKHKITYIKQYCFNNCKYKQRLFFDFAIFENNELKCLLEFDGLQHFKPIKYFGGIETFKINKKRDEIKNNYCLENNIKLLRIPYNNINNIDEKLKNYLKEK